MDSDDEWMKIGNGSPYRNRLASNQDSTFDSDISDDEGEKSLGNSQLDRLLEEARDDKSLKLHLNRNGDVSQNEDKTSPRRETQNHTKKINIDCSSEVPDNDPLADINTLEDTKRAIDKEKNSRSVLDKDSHGFKKYVVRTFVEYNPQLVTKTLLELKKNMEKTGGELVKLTWEKLWTNSFLSKVDKVSCKNSLGQIKSEQCRMLFYETALQTHESENTELIYQRSLFLQSLVLGQSITHFPGTFNSLYHKEGLEQYRNSKRIKTVKNHFFGWSVCFDHFLEIFRVSDPRFSRIKI